MEEVNNRLKTLFETSLNLFFIVILLTLINYIIDVRVDNKIRTYEVGKTFQSEDYIIIRKEQLEGKNGFNIFSDKDKDKIIINKKDIKAAEIDFKNGIVENYNKEKEFLEK